MKKEPLVTVAAITAVVAAWLARGQVASPWTVEKIKTGHVPHGK